MLTKTNSNSPRLVNQPCYYYWFVAITISCVINNVNTRHVTLVQSDDPLVAAAAEPRPVFVEPEPSANGNAFASQAQALPLVYEVGTPVMSDGVGVASEQVEKVLRPAAAFSYTVKNHDQEAANSNRNEKESREEEEEGGEESDEEETEGSEEETELEKNPGAYFKEEEAQKVAKEAVTAESGDKKQVAAPEADTETQASGHEGGGEAHYQKGGGKEFHADHHSQHGAKGDKGYDGYHKHEKGQKGHHKKEGHKKQFHDEGGAEKKHHHADGYFREHNSEEEGQKGSKYGEGGEHSKGHSTKGSHSIHKKDEYEKKTEFFDEDEDGSEYEKEGAYSSEKDFHKGGHEKASHKKGAEHDDHYGKETDSKKGHHYKDEKGHKDAHGHDHHHSHVGKHGDKEEDSHGKKWGYKHVEGTGGGGGGGGGGGHHAAHSHVVKVQEAAVVAPAKPQQEQKQDQHGSHANYATAAQLPVHFEPPQVHEHIIENVPQEFEPENDNQQQPVPYVSRGVVPEEILYAPQQEAHSPDGAHNSNDADDAPYVIYEPSAKELVEAHSFAQRRIDYDETIEEPQTEQVKPENKEQNEEVRINIQLDEDGLGTDEISKYVEQQTKQYISPQMPKLIDAVHEVHRNTPSSKELVEARPTQQSYQENDNEDESENNNDVDDSDDSVHIAEGSNQRFVIVAAE